MSISIETVGFCPQYFSHWEVRGSSDGKSYEVTLNGAEGAPYCTCLAFKFSGGYGNQNCKHVEKVWKHGCLYNPQWKDEGANDYQDHGIKLINTDERVTLRDEPCKGCGEPTIPVRIEV